MQFSMPYGHSQLTAELDWRHVLATLDIAEAAPIADIQQAARKALEAPIGMEKDIFHLVTPGERIAIIVSDSFRQTGIHLVLPTLVQGLIRAGISAQDICFVFATGVHRPPTLDEQEQILGTAIFGQFQHNCHAHDPYDAANLVHLGTTSRGTPVTINRRAWDCDRIIATGTVVMHYFGGFGGGRKSILPGIASAESIAHNHAMNLDAHEDRLDPSVRIGALDGNPVAEDMLEGARMADVDYTINTVLNRQSEIAAIFAGELDAAHRAAAEFARGLFAVPITEKADLVIASAGSAKNFVQSHKALYNAWQALNHGGRLVFLAKCEEGLGAEKFAQWVRLRERSAIIKELRKNSEINGQTALSTIEKAPSAIFVTDMSETEVALLGGRKAASLTHALELARDDLSGTANPVCYLMPSASYSVPVLARA